MASTTRTYFLCPHFDYPPSSISLGHIISSPSDPSNALNLDEVDPPSPSDVFSSSKRGVSIDRNQLNDGQTGILSKFLRVFGFGSDAEQGDGSGDSFEFDRVDTMFFKPSTAYLRKAVQAEGVQRFLAASRSRKPLYVVTGVKIVKGAKSSSTRSQKGMKNLTVTGVPISVGPGIEVASRWSESKSFQSVSEFVFAFQLSKLLVERTGHAGKSLDKFAPNLDLKPDVALEDAGIGGVRDVVAEEVLDDNKEQSPSVVLYSAESYTKGALF